MIGMAKGMITTFKHLVRPALTVQYPNVKRELPERSRMSFTLPLDENGVPLCKSCMLCANSCPDRAIQIESEKRADGPGRVLKSFTIDLGLCMYCGICVENCASAGLRHNGNFETATHERGETMLVLYKAAAANTAPAAMPATDAPAATEEPSA